MSLPTTARQEQANTLTHAIGFLLSIIGVPFLLWSTRGEVNAAVWTGLWVFSATLLLVYLVSSLYHYVEEPRLKFMLRKADHISIYILIAGTHTPLLLHYMPGSWYLIVIWSMAGAGLIYKLFFFGKCEWLSVTFYLVMGWMGVLTIPVMMEQMPLGTLHGIVWGGVSYTVGVVFYAWQKLPYHHAIWHVFVMGGSLGHFLGIWAMA